MNADAVNSDTAIIAKRAALVSDVVSLVRKKVPTAGDPITAHFGKRVAASWRSHGTTFEVDDDDDVLVTSSLRKDGRVFCKLVESVDEATLPESIANEVCVHLLRVEAVGE